MNFPNSQKHVKEVELNGETVFDLNRIIILNLGGRTMFNDHMFDFISNYIKFITDKEMSELNKKVQLLEDRVSLLEDQETILKKKIKKQKKELKALDSLFKRCITDEDAFPEDEESTNDTFNQVTIECTYYNEPDFKELVDKYVEYNRSKFLTAETIVPTLLDLYYRSYEKQADDTFGDDKESIEDKVKRWLNNQLPDNELEEIFGKEDLFNTDEAYQSYAFAFNEDFYDGEYLDVDKVEDTLFGPSEPSIDFGGPFSIYGPDNKEIFDLDDYAKDKKNTDEEMLDPETEKDIAELEAMLDPDNDDQEEDEDFSKFINFMNSDDHTPYKYDFEEDSEETEEEDNEAEEDSKNKYNEIDLEFLIAFSDSL